MSECIEEDIEEETEEGNVVQTREEEGLWTLLFVDNTKASAAITNHLGMAKLKCILEYISYGCRGTIW